MSKRFYRMFYKQLHVYTKEHISYRIFKKRWIKKFNKFRKLISASYGISYIDTDSF